MSDDDFNARSVSRPRPADPHQTFWDAADRFIQLANEEAKTGERSQVCAAILYAAARYNAFAASDDAPDAETFKQEIEPAIHYFRTEFEKMLRENWRDYAEHFRNYHPEKFQ